MLDELESIKPEAQRLLDDLGRSKVKEEPYQLDGEERAPYASASFIEWPAVNNSASLSYDNQKVLLLTLFACLQCVAVHMFLMLFISFRNPSQACSPCSSGL